MNTPAIDQLRPMLVTEGSIKPFTDPAWLYEIKYDGYRTLAGFGDSAGVQLRTRRGMDCTSFYPEVSDALSKLPGGPHVVDGEACVLGDLGRSVFNDMHERAAHRRWYPGCSPVTLVAFDILVHAGRNVMGLPLMQRKALLRDLFSKAAKQSLLYLQDLPAEVDLFDQVVNGLKLEGLVAKRRDSIYRPGERTTDWRKIKRAGWQEGRVWRA